MRNVGGLDKAVRILLGVGLALLGVLAPMGAGPRVAVLLVAAVALFTGLFGF
jgi:hypothetical protein